MNSKVIIAGVLMDEHTMISFVDVCQKCNISEAMLLDMMDHGLCNYQNRPEKIIDFDEQMLSRIQSACRLQRDLDLNLPGVVLVLELLDELTQLRNELGILQHHVDL